MPTPGLLEHLSASALLSAEQLAELAALPEAHAGDLRALARQIVQRGWLTRYQVNEVAQGRGKSLRIGSYVVLERLGEGGMGQVFKARHEHMERVVALKLMRKEKLAKPDSVRRFYQEVKAAAALVHPNIVLAFDAGQAGSTHFFSMEYVDGTDLDRLVDRQGPLPVPQACECVRQAALGLQHAHERGLVHRDVKPSNLLVSQAKGQPPVVKVLDLGLARLSPSFSQERKLTRMGSMLGTPDYLAPEQARDARSVDARADVYSLGCTLFFLLTRRAPFQAEALAELLLKHQMEAPPSIRHLRPEVPEEIDELLQRTLAKRPQERPATAAEVAAALAPYARGERIGVGQTMAVSGSALPPVSWSALEGLTEADEEARQGSRHALLESGTAEARKPRRGRPRRQPDGQRTLLLLAVGVVAGLVLLGALLLGGKKPAEERAVKGAPEHAKQAPPEPPAPKVPAGQERLLTTPSGMPAQSVHYSPDGTRALSAVGLEVVVHDLSDGKVLRSMRPANATVVSVAASKDWKRVLTAGADNVLRLWDVEAGKQVGLLADRLETFHHVIAVSADGKYGLSAGGGSLRRDGKPVRDAAGKDVLGDFEVRLWNLETGKEEHRFGGSTWHTQSAAFSDDGKYVLASSHDFPLRVWDLGSKKQVHTIGPSADWPHTAVQVVPAGGSHILIGRKDGSVWLWDCATGTVVRRFTGKHAAAVTRLAVSADGKTALTIAGGNRPGAPPPEPPAVRVWDVERGTEAGRIELAEAPLSAAVSPDGKHALIGLRRGIRYVALPRRGP
jgi:serine/threonine protein kinase